MLTKVGDPIEILETIKDENLYFFYLKRKKVKTHAKSRNISIPATTPCFMQVLFFNFALQSCKKIYRSCFAHFMYSEDIKDI